MKKRVNIFNPEHDLALAFGGENYTAPPMAQMLRRNLQVLPVWISSPNDYILSQNIEEDSKFLKTLQDKYGISAEIMSYSQLGDADEIEPWGWDMDLRKRLWTIGARKEIMPRDEDIAVIRRFSHRRITIDFHRAIREQVRGIECEDPMELDRFEDIHEFAVRYPEAYIKAPWSASGKGIFRVLDSEAIEFERWCRGILKRQKSVLCERPLDGLLDFALEYECQDEEVSFIGYSVFHNDAHRSFDSGEVMSSEKLRRKIADTLQNEELIDEVKEVLNTIIKNKIAPHYNGNLGVDMLIYKNEDGSPRLNPCIEINLRNTMGIVTSVIGDRIVDEGSHGVFRIEYHKKAIGADYIGKMEQKYPLTIEKGKIIKGFQMLAPLYNDSRYCAYVICERD